MTIKRRNSKPRKNSRKPIGKTQKDRQAGAYTEIVCILDRSG